MGIMQGKVVDGTIIVMDAFALPVEGTETRVNAQAEAYEYMVEFTQTNKRAGRLENVVGWYHSHPGYGCWLSGIDVSTQMLNQEFQEPFLAVVIDPTRTVSAGKMLNQEFQEPFLAVVLDPTRTVSAGKVGLGRGGEGWEGRAMESREGNGEQGGQWRAGRAMEGREGNGGQGV
ncbi:unnamed protein product [Closterium sp. NIES-54]